jgi:hypothetical protein
MLNPHMKGWGSYEATRRRAQELEEHTIENSRFAII